MEKHQKKTIYQYTTSSERTARAVELLLKDPKTVTLLLLFANIKGSKRKNVVLRVAGYLGASTQHHG